MEEKQNLIKLFSDEQNFSKNIFLCREEFNKSNKFSSII